MEATRVWNHRLNPRVGDTFVTNFRNPILTVVEDTSPGVHDSFMAACDRQRYERLGIKEYHRNCFDNMIEAMSSAINVFRLLEARPGLEARLARPVFYELVEWGEEEPIAGEPQFGVWSGGMFFCLGDPGEDT